MRKYRLSSFIAGAGYLLFWYLYLFILPFDQITVNYANVINAPGWFFVNAFQVVGLIAFVLFYFGIRPHIFPDSILAYLMNVLQCLGFFCLIGIAYSETFVWPILSGQMPGTLDVYTGGIFTDIALRAFNIGSVVAFMISNIYFGIKLRKLYPVAGVIYCVGMTLFCLGFASGGIRYFVQTIGLSVFSISFISLGLKKI
jgi:hypothetical protein